MNKIQALAVTNEEVRFLLQENESLKEENAILHSAQFNAEYYEGLFDQVKLENQALKRTVEVLELKLKVAARRIKDLEEMLEEATLAGMEERSWKTASEITFTGEILPSP